MASRRDIESGAAFVRLYLKNDLNKQLKSALQSAGSQVRGIGTRIAKAGAGVTAIGTAIAAPLLGAVKHFASVGDQLDKMSIRTGISVESLSALQFAADQTGTSIESLAQALFRARRRIGNAITETGPAARALKELGLNAQELSEQSPEDQFLQLVDALQGVGNEARRNQLAFEIFGDNFRQIQPLLDQGADGIEELMKKAEELGIVMSTEDAKAAAEFTDAMDALKKQIMATVRSVGSALAPALTSLLKRIQPVAKRVIEWTQENGGLIRTVGAVAAGLIGAGGALTVFGVAIIGVGAVLSGLGTILGVVGSAVSALLSPIGLVGVALTAGVALWATYTKSGQDAVKGIGNLLGQLGKIVKDTFGGIAKALQAGDLKLAGEIAFTGLQLAGATAMAALAKGWDVMVAHMSLAWEQWSEGVVSVFSSTIDGITNTLATALKTYMSMMIDFAGSDLGQFFFKGTSFEKVAAGLQTAQARAFAKAGVNVGIDNTLAPGNQIAKTMREDAARRVAMAEKELADARARSPESPRVKELQDKLEDLKDTAVLLEHFSKQGTGAGSDTAMAIGKGIAEGEEQAKKSSSFVTFSAADAQAIGFGGRTLQEKQVDETKKTRKAVEDSKAILEEKLEVDKRIIDAIENFSLGYR